MRNDNEIRSSKEYEHAKFDFFCTRYRQGDWFTCQLFRLFDKADEENRYKLGKSFPVEHLVWKDWHRSATEETFFAEYLKSWNIKLEH